MRSIFSSDLLTSMCTWVDIKIKPLENSKKLMNLNTKVELDNNNGIYVDYQDTINFSFIKFSGYTFGDVKQYATLGMYDASGNLLYRYASSANTATRNAIVPVPSGTARIIINGHKSYPPMLSYASINTNIINIFNTTNPKRIFHKKYNKDVYNFEFKLSDFTINGYYLTTADEGQSLQTVKQTNVQQLNWYMNPIIYSIDELTYYKIDNVNLYNYSNRSLMFLCFDSELNLVKLSTSTEGNYIGASITGSTTAVVKFTPKNAKYIVFFIDQSLYHELIDGGEDIISIKGYKFNGESVIDLNTNLNNCYKLDKYIASPTDETNPLYSHASTSKYSLIISNIPEGCKHVISHDITNKLHDLYFIKKYPGAFIRDANVTRLYNSGHNVINMYDVPDNAVAIACNLNNSTDKIRDVDDIQYSRVNFTVGALADKRICIIGDSLTYLNGYQYTIDDEYRYSLGFQYELFNEGAIVESYGYSGKPYAAYTNDYLTDNIVSNFKTESLNKIDKYDIFILFGGANDVRISTPIGDESLSYASPNLNESTFHGAIGSLIKYIRENNPTSHIYLCTLTPSTDSSRYYEKNKRYRDAIIQEAEFWHCPIIDLWTQIDVTPKIGDSVADSFRNYSYDGIHPNYYGMRRLGKILSNRLINDAQCELI